MRRREFLGILGGAAATWPRAARAQAGMPIIGYLATGSPDAFASRLAALRQGIGEHGYIEGRNVAIEYRWASGLYDQMQAFADDLVARRVDVIVAIGPPSLRAAEAATSIIPIVFVVGSDPIRDGLIVSMSRPDRNLTGVTFLAVDLTPKRLQLVAELVPRTKLIALLANPSNRAEERVAADAQAAAKAAGLGIAILSASTDNEIDAAFEALTERHAGVLIVSPDTLFTTRAEKIATLAIQHTIPTIFAFRESVLAGGLASYGPSTPRVHQEAGRYVGRILKGDKPGDLPVLQPTTFDFTINLKTAKALGLDVPPALLARADEVIE
jgi:putative tryptophan/tyrosine transport system substrate-binding protein